MDSSPIESDFLSTLAKEKGFSACFFYRGLSMSPSFRDGDLLYLRLVEKNDLSVGDVIVFSSPKNNKHIVHRIVAISNRGYVTCGDHSYRNDRISIPIEDIIGKVVCVENNHGTIPVINGLIGIWMAKFWHYYFWLDHLFRKLLWMPYSIIREKQFAVIFWHPKITRIQVDSEENQQIKYIYNNHTVAIWDSSSQYFNCQKPFDLIIPPPLKK